MIYKAVEVIWIFSADGRDGTGIEGTIRGPRGPKKYSKERSTKKSTKKMPKLKSFEPKRPIFTFRGVPKMALWVPESKFRDHI